MIVKTPGDWTDFIMKDLMDGAFEYSDRQLHVSETSLLSLVLKPDGTPFLLKEKKPKFGFDLTPSQTIPSEE